MYFGANYWIIPYHSDNGDDIQKMLEELGFTIQNLHDNISCVVTPPMGWFAKPAEKPKKNIVPEMFPANSTEWTEGMIIFDATNTPRIQAIYYHGDEEDLFDSDGGWLNFA